MGKKTRLPVPTVPGLNVSPAKLNFSLSALTIGARG